MSIFRASARVTSPDGREWEIYAYKIRVRERGYDDPLGEPSTAGTSALDRVFLGLVLEAVSLVPRGLRRLADVVARAIRSVRSDEWTIDAVTYLPHQTVYTWTTTREHKGQVLAQVEGTIARGDIPVHLAHAVYRGEDRRSAR